jgi:hypothetical protein
MSDRKRSLELLPEILPAPPPLADGGPRQRTLESLRRLAAAAGAAATISGCDPGYGVVDPVPPPARCPGLAESIDATVARKTATTVVLTAGKPRFNGAAYVTEPPAVTGGTLVSYDVQPDSATFEIAPTSGQVSVSISVTCPNGPSRVIAYFSPAALPDAGTTSVMLVDGMP